MVVMTENEVFCGLPAALEEILDCRSRRAERQRALLAQGTASLISFSLNIPGAMKQFPLAHRAFLEGLAALRAALPADCVLHLEQIRAVTGSEALLCLSLPPDRAKRITMELEDTHPLGRLFDMDVLGPDGVALSRGQLGCPARRCMLCSADAKLCARSAAHPAKQIRAFIASLLTGYFFPGDTNAGGV